MKCKRIILSRFFSSLWDEKALSHRGSYQFQNVVFSFCFQNVSKRTKKGLYQAKNKTDFVHFSFSKSVKSDSGETYKKPQECSPCHIFTIFFLSWLILFFTLCCVSFQWSSRAFWFQLQLFICLNEMSTAVRIKSWLTMAYYFSPSSITQYSWQYNSMYFSLLYTIRRATVHRHRKDNK